MKLIEQVKIMNTMETSQEVLNHVEFIIKIKEAESYKSIIGLDNNYKSFEKLETIGYKIAVKKAITVEEIEKCATEVEEKYCGKYDPDEWAEQIRIKAYGIEWYIKRQFNSPVFEEVLDFAKSNANI